MYDKDGWVWAIAGGFKHIRPHLERHSIFVILEADEHPTVQRKDNKEFPNLDSPPSFYMKGKSHDSPPFISAHTPLESHHHPSTLAIPDTPHYVPS